MKTIYSKDPYILDYVDFNQPGIVALTDKNVKFIEAMIKLNSRYGKKSKTQDIFEKMNNGSNFSDCLREVIIDIDITNSTRIGKDGRDEFIRRIIKDYSCDNVEQLKSLLSQRFLVNDKKHILYKLTEEVISTGKGYNRYNLSFATKFCSYASQFLGLGDKYSKYDNVVAKSLPVYSEIYLSEKVPDDYFLVSGSAKNKLEHRMEIYYRYIDCIDRILCKLKSENIKISKSELDHIIWYSNK